LTRGISSIYLTIPLHVGPVPSVLRIRVRNFLQDPDPELEVMDPALELYLQFNKNHQKNLKIMKLKIRHPVSYYRYIFFVYRYVPVQVPYALKGKSNQILWYVLWCNSIDLKFLQIRSVLVNVGTYVFVSNFSIFA
jgi:hypothetical protein